MKRLILVLNGKGGVGKRFFAVNLVQYLIDRKIAHTAIDTDNENSTLKRFHPNAEFVDLAAARGLDRIFILMETTELAIVDCRAASSDLLAIVLATARRSRCQPGRDRAWFGGGRREARAGCPECANLRKAEARIADCERPAASPKGWCGRSGCATAVPFHDGQIASNNLE